MRILVLTLMMSFLSNNLFGANKFSERQELSEDTFPLPISVPVELLNYTFPLPIPESRRHDLEKYLNLSPIALYLETMNVLISYLLGAADNL